MVLLRARSGPAVGMGHVMRTRAVAQALLDLGVVSRVLVDDKASLQQLRSEGLEADIARPEAHLLDQPWRAAWIDVSEDCSQTLSALERTGIRSVLVENRTCARDHAWRLLYPTLHHRPDAWDEAHTRRVLAGPVWIPFAREWRSNVRGARREHDVLVTFGGSDPNRLTERVLNALGTDVGRVVVVLGAHMLSRRTAIERAGAHLRGLQLVAGCSCLRPWMASSRMAITAVGTTLYELAHVGTPALVLANYATDEPALAHYAEHGPHWPVGVAHELDEECLRERLREGIELARSVRPEVVDGLGDGASRIARLLVHGEVAA